MDQWELPLRVGPSKARVAAVTGAGASARRGVRGSSSPETSRFAHPEYYGNTRKPSGEKLQAWVVLRFERSRRCSRIGFLVGKPGSSSSFT